MVLLMIVNGIIIIIIMIDGNVITSLASHVMTRGMFEVIHNIEVYVLHFF